MPKHKVTNGNLITNQTEQACAWFEPRMAFWEGLVPERVMNAQVKWERYRDIARMRALGFTHAAIAVRLGISGCRVAQLFAKIEQNKGPGSSPVELYCKELLPIKQLISP